MLKSDVGITIQSSIIISRELNMWVEHEDSSILATLFYSTVNLNPALSNISKEERAKNIPLMFFKILHQV